MHEKMPQLTILIACTVGLLGAILLGQAIGSSETMILLEIVGATLGIAWLVLAGQYWWLPMAFGLGIGGFFTIPYKVYPHELALGMSLAGLLPQLVLTRSSYRTGRPALPLIFYVLALYLVGNFAMSMIQTGGEGAGNITRAYMNALWAMVFGYYFWRFGSTRFLRAALRTVYVAALIRMVFGLVNYYADTVYIIPGINYSIDPQDLRASGSIMFVLALIFTLMRGSALVRFANSVMMLISVWVILLGGSRGGVVMLLFVPLFALAIYRRWIPLIAGAACASLLVFWLNVYPKVLENLPTRATRAASVLLLNEKLDAQQTARDSTEWHKVVLPNEAYKRWSRNTTTMLFGTGIRPYRQIAGGMYQGRVALYRMAEVSADMGAYESAFWTVLTVLGLTGLILYVLLMLWFGRRLFVALWNRKARDSIWGALFWASLLIAQWFVFAIPAGGYPSWEIFLGVIALAALADEPAKVPARKMPEPVAISRPRRALVPAAAR